MGGKDTTETLIHESKKHNEEEGIGNIKVILRGLGGPAGVFDGSSAQLPFLRHVGMNIGGCSTKWES